MAQKIFKYRGKTIEELKKLSTEDFAKLLPARQRRSILRRNKSNAQKAFAKKLGRKSNNVKTHRRDVVILPTMVGKIFQIHNGKTFVPVAIQEEMIGHFFGEFAVTRNKVKHSAPGIGATRSSASVSVK